jgi:ribose transport system substrate-binding protein
MNVVHKKSALVALIALFVMLVSACVAPVAPAAQAPAEGAAAESDSSVEPVAEKLTYCYVSPGPDTWYQRDVDGFVFGAESDGHEVIVLNSEYDVEKELANIESCINQGVDGISMFSFNENGAIVAARRGLEAGIPVVATDSVGSVQRAGQEIVAEIDFDWYGMGVDYADWMAENHPGENFVILTGNLESIPSQEINRGMIERSEELGQNALVSIEDTNYNPNTAVDLAQNVLEAGEEFGIMFVMDEDMAAAVIRMLEDRNVLNNPIKVIAQNGSPAGIPLVKDGKLQFTISSSPGWEGLIAYLALHNNVIGRSDAINQQFMLPVIDVTLENIDDPMAVVPWEVDPIYWELTQQYFPALLEYRASQ